MDRYNEVRVDIEDNSSVATHYSLSAQLSIEGRLKMIEIEMKKQNGEMEMQINLAVH